MAGTCGPDVAALHINDTPAQQVPKTDGLLALRKLSVELDGPDEWLARSDAVERHNASVAMGARRFARPQAVRSADQKAIPGGGSPDVCFRCPLENGREGRERGLEQAVAVLPAGVVLEGADLLIGQNLEGDHVRRPSVDGDVDRTVVEDTPVDEVMLRHVPRVGPIEADALAGKRPGHG